MGATAPTPVATRSLRSPSQPAARCEPVPPAGIPTRIGPRVSCLNPPLSARPLPLQPHTHHLPKHKTSMRPRCPKAFRPVGPDRRSGIEESQACRGMDLTAAARSRRLGIEDQQGTRLIGLPDERDNLRSGPGKLGVSDFEMGHQLRTEPQESCDLRAVGTIVRGTRTVRKPVGQQEENVTIRHPGVTHHRLQKSSAGPPPSEVNHLSGDLRLKSHGYPTATSGDQVHKTIQ